MNGTDIKSYESDQGLIVKAKVKRYKNDEKISDYTITIGTELVVKPMNKQKIKHRDRKIKVISFNFSKDYGQRVNVIFLDNNRRGIIEISDLDTFE
ncbi:hypothetical protein [Psychrobacillus sp.]|uniref:hypothetical protein n=1 Tax=Psychrobacillus sp. TaxID=1871623 RepID=UPI0028BD7901|nr:hypothetical protein [Psychrobacillus sp.]